MLGASSLGKSRLDRAVLRSWSRLALGSLLSRARNMPLRSRVLAALLAVIAVSETVIAVSFYNQQKQHSIAEQLVSDAQRMHELGDFQFAVAQLALQSVPATQRQISELRSMLGPYQALESQGSSAERTAAHRLVTRSASLARTREQFDQLRRTSPQRAVDRTEMVTDARALTAITEEVHNAADARVRSAQQSAHTRENDAFQTLIVGSSISVSAAVVLALMLAGTITRPVARLAAGARQLGAGHLDHRLPVGPRDEIGVVATEFNRMAAQLQDASTTLEQRVRTRTEELAEANHQLDLHRAEQERLAQQRRTLLGRVITAQEEERQRIARELHDETGQSLTALSLGLEAAGDQLRSGEGGRAGERLAGLQHVAAEALRELERLVLDLRPAQLDRLGLVATLRWYVARVRSQTGLSVDLDVGGQSRRVALEMETTVFRLAQEALTNVVRHAQATHASVALSFSSDSVCLEVRDDGIGFDAQTVASAPSSIGLIGMRERVQLIGGSLMVRSRPGHGTCVTVSVPVDGER